MAKTFEQSLKELEKIVSQLEDGDLPLEKSLELFEAGVKLSRECRERLTQAERRIEILTKDSEGVLQAVDLDTETLRSERKPIRGKPVAIGEIDPDEAPF